MKTKRVAAKQSPKSIYYIMGYEKGRLDGFEKGRQGGKARGFQDAIHTAAQTPMLLGRALIITPSPELPSLEIMLCQPFRELRNRGICDFTVLQEDMVTRGHIEEASLVIFLRTVEPAAYQFLNWAHEMGKKTIYAIDDNFLEIPANSDVASYYMDPQRRDTFVKFLRNSQIVKVDSQYFADYIRIYFNPRVAYFSSSVDMDWLESAPRRTRRDGKIIIGYEGTSKEEDFEQVVPALHRILDEHYGQVELEFYGFMPAAMANQPYVTHVPDHQEYRSFIQQLYQNTWNIGLAPLIDGVFNYCKTNNKFREYAACGIPGVYSDNPAYTQCVVPNETGIIVPHTSDGWYMGIKQLIDNPGLRKNIRDNAYHYAKQNYSIAASADSWFHQILSV